MIINTEITQLILLAILLLVSIIIIITFTCDK